MTNSFDKYSVLDPALLERQIEADHGSALFDRFSVLDPQHMRAQINAGLGIELSDDALLDPQRMIAEILAGALSETGVTNTAPHDLAVFAWNTDITTDGTVSASDIPGDVLIATLHAIDDEGNQPLYTMTDDLGGKFSLNSNGYNADLFAHGPLDAGTYSPVVRATDPDGLYVEQTFTVTVEGPTTPVLTLATGVGISSTEATVTVTTDRGGGALYYVVTEYGGGPTSDQVIAGTDGLDAPATYANNTTPDPGLNTFTAVGLTPSTSYFVWFVHVKDGLTSNVLGCDPFATE